MAHDLPTGTLLSGYESQRLREFCSKETYTSSDLDSYALKTLADGNLTDVQTDFKERVASNGLASAQEELASIAYGPTKVPLFNYLLQLAILNPEKRPKYIEIIDFLTLECKVPVDTPDLSGNTTLMYAISTKPYFDTDIADILIRAGGDINKRNRYGCVAAHDIVMVGDHSSAGKKKAADALRYFLSYGGNIDIKDGDGITARNIAMRLSSIVPELGQVINALASRSPGSGPAATGVAKGPKIGRNDPCSCGSKRKYKVCCGKN